MWNSSGSFRVARYGVPSKAGRRRLRPMGGLSLRWLAITGAPRRGGPFRTPASWEPGVTRASLPGRDGRARRHPRAASRSERVGQARQEPEDTQRRRLVERVAANPVGALAVERVSDRRAVDL